MFHGFQKSKHNVEPKQAVRKRINQTSWTTVSELTGKHSMEVGTAGCQHHFVRFDFFVGDMEHDVTEEAALSHPVHGHKGVVVVSL